MSFFGACSPGYDYETCLETRPFLREICAGAQRRYTEPEGPQSALNTWSDILGLDGRVIYSLTATERVLGSNPDPSFPMQKGSIYVSTVRNPVAESYWGTGTPI